MNNYYSNVLEKINKDIGKPHWKRGDILLYDQEEKVEIGEVVLVELKTKPLTYEVRFYRISGELDGRVGPLVLKNKGRVGLKK